MNEHSAMLIVRDLARSFEGGAVQALRGVSFQADAGEVVALTGPSGCGKSTLLSLLGLLDRPSAGSVDVAGRPLATVRDCNGFRARNIGFVFQFHHMVSTMTLQENVEAPMVALGVPRTERKARARLMLEHMDLTHRADFLPASVSGGERQRAAVARALINQPRLLLADEPTGNLDSKNGQRVIDLLVRHARARGALVLIATHNADIAQALDRTIELRDGELVSASVVRSHASMPSLVRVF
jgi:ABC-type lipoprotein export system ATPase subunit